MKLFKRKKPIEIALVKIDFENVAMLLEEYPTLVKYLKEKELFFSSLQKYHYNRPFEKEDFKSDDEYNNWYQKRIESLEAPYHESETQHA